MSARVSVVFAVLLGTAAAVSLPPAAPAAAGVMRFQDTVTAGVPQAVSEDSSEAVDSVPASWTAPAPFALDPIEPFPGSTARTRPALWLTVLLAGLTAAVLFLAIVLVLRRLTARRYWSEEPDAELAPLVFNRPASSVRGTAPGVTGPPAPVAVSANLPAGPAARQAEPVGAAEARPAEPADDVTKGVAAGYNHGPAATVAPVEQGEPPGIEVEAGPIRFHRPPAGTLQLLPGRLEIVSGNERHEEIRFVKLPRAAPVVTFGRVPGAAYRHVQLQSPTVSRMHAAMQFQGGRWHIENLSHTNPVVVNGRRLAVNGAAEMLNEGDQVEMGEVVFRFRAR